MIRFKHTGDFTKTKRYLKRAGKLSLRDCLNRFGKEGVDALASATPVDTGLTAASWYYDISEKDGRAAITFSNSNVQNGCPIAIILQYGHGTKNGGWVEGRDYINPAIRPIFDKIADNAWKEVTGL